ncbi:hypothetical protein F9L16_09225 [Agarivorans sp. B2Z047]|nr:hypothetical protein [Agarivorans sp. B2Z047]
MGIADEAIEIAIYSPTQAACGALLGGPIGLIYFLMANFGALENDNARRKTLYSGIVLIIAQLFLLPILPENFPSTPFAVVYIITARMIAEKYQLTKSDIADSEQYRFHSNWKVFGLSLLCLLGSMAVIMIPLAVLDMLGVVAL